MQKKRKTQMRCSKIQYVILYTLCTKIGWSDMISALRGHKIHSQKIQTRKHVLIANVSSWSLKLSFWKCCTFGSNAVIFPSYRCICSRTHILNSLREIVCLQLSGNPIWIFCLSLLRLQKLPKTAEQRLKVSKAACLATTCPRDWY